MESHLESSSSLLRSRWFLAAFVVLAIGIRIAFWATTDRVWEDAYITVRHAENAASGRGLTHHPAQGDPVHGFTSAISVLIPLASEIFVSGSGIDFLKISSLAAAALTICLALRIAQHPTLRLSLPATIFFLGFLALEFHQILFGMAAMETQWIVLITLGVIGCFLEQRPWWMGAWCGAALWGRPDGVICLLAVLCGTAWQRRWSDIPRIAAGAAAVIAPWIVFTEVYYGSFIPHTVIAKKTAYFWAHSDDAAKAWLAEIARRANSLRLWLSPGHGGGGWSTINFVRGARLWQLIYGSLIAVGIYRSLNQKRLSVISFYSVGFGAYLLIFVPFPAFWYLVPWLAVLALAFSRGTDLLRRSRFAALRLSGIGLPLLYLGLYAFATGRCIPAEREIQRGVEDACRTQIGKWLNTHTAPEHWVGCECLGYIGSFSHRPILDYPGLASPRSVAALQAMAPKTRSLPALIAAERPEWLVLRPIELQIFRERYPDVANTYVAVKEFASDPEAVKRLGEWLWCDGYLLIIDEHFTVLRRMDVQESEFSENDQIDAGRTSQSNTDTSTTSAELE